MSKKKELKCKGCCKCLEYKEIECFDYDSLKYSSLSNEQKDDLRRKIKSLKKLVRVKDDEIKIACLQRRFDGDYYYYVMVKSEDKPWWKFWQ